MKRCLALALVLTLGGCGVESAHEQAPQAQTVYPAATRGGQLDTYHGVGVADPYRALEELDAPATRTWVDAENALARPYLEAIPARERIKQRLTRLWNYERYDIPISRAGRYFYRRNDGLQNQSVLYVADGIDGKPRVLLDPNTISKDATIALAEIVPSNDGKLVAYSLSDGGTDWRVWKVRDVATARDLPDELRFIKFADVSWTADSRSLYYARYPLLPDGTGDAGAQRIVYHHRLGTQQSADEEVFRITDHPTRSPYVFVMDDSRYAVFYIYDGNQRAGLSYRRLDASGAPTGDPVVITNSFDGEYELLGELDDVFYIRTTAGSPNSRIVAVPVSARSAADWRTIIPESKLPMLTASLVGRRLITEFSRDAFSLVRVASLGGKPLYDVKLPGHGQASGFLGSATEAETFFLYTDFLTPPSISRLNLETGEVSLFRAPKVNADLSAYVTEQVFYPSKDGTRVPMFITHRRDLKRDGTAPTMLYGYGGFGIPQQPEFSTPVLVWLEMGGVFASANLRGGAEYGEDWHQGGTKLRKQNVFDDFIAAAEWLIEEKYTSTPKLVIRGRSNGGLLVGAALTQRPDLFGAALPAVGVLDMLRYHTASANARQWSNDYGLSENEAEFRAQYAYSPLHNIREGTCYPPTLVTTADHDDRVVPWHSYKFAATLQHAQRCANPVLLRVETRAGHGSGKPVWMQIEDFADQWAFVAKALEMGSVELPAG